MIQETNCAVWALAISLLFTGWTNGGEQGAAKVETLARHATVSEFCGTNYHRCMGPTPDSEEWRNAIQRKAFGLGRGL